MKSNKLGIYVHIPLCVKKCNYCDFCSFANLEKETRAEYVEQLCKEILSYKGKTHDYRIESIFFGGGTPSLLSASEFSVIVDALRDAFAINGEIEFTIEANPKTLTDENLSAYIACGVNRLSIGLQSVHANELKALGRIHTLDDFISSLTLARNKGIENINVDIMYAIPEQTRESFMETVDTVCALPVNHISAYSLIIEDSTPFGRMRDSLVLPSEDDELFMVDYLHQKLAQHGYTHYEISNYAKHGRESRHNLLYWNMDEYIGVGLGAHSDFLGARYSNSTDMHEYLSKEYIQYRVIDTPDREQRAFEYAMLRLRLKEGLSLSEYQNRFHRSFIEGKEEYLEQCVRGGYLLMDEEHLSFTEAGFYVSNEILAEIL